MRILFDPQVREKDRIAYEFSEYVIKATYKDTTDVFDFREVGNGELVLSDPDTGESLIETNLDIQPIISAKKENGVLSVELINFIGFDASEEECFPEWIEHEDYRGTKPDTPTTKEFKVKIKSWKGNSDKLQEQKENKKRELSRACEESILGGFDFKINNIIHHFSYDREAQSNYQERWQLFQNNVIDTLKMTAHVNDDDVRLEVNKDLFNKIYLESVKAKENKIRKLRDDLFPLVDSARSIKDLETISWSMDIIDPKPDTIRIKDDKLLDKEIKRVEQDNALTAGELMTLIFMSQMGMGG